MYCATFIVHNIINADYAAENSFLLLGPRRGLNSDLWDHKQAATNKATRDCHLSVILTFMFSAKTHRESADFDVSDARGGSGANR